MWIRIVDMLGPKVVTGRIAMLDVGDGVEPVFFEFSGPGPAPRGEQEDQEGYLL